MAKSALRREPTYRIQPVRDTGRVYAGGPGGEPKTPSVPRGAMRLSPGVYRAPSGGLMTGQGRALPPQGQRLADSMKYQVPSNLPPMQSLVQNVANQPIRRGLAPNEPMPTPPPPVDMQKPWMNFQVPQMPQLPQARAPQSQQLSMGQVANMSGDEIQRYIDQLQQIRQMQQQQQQPGAPVFPQTTQG